MTDSSTLQLSPVQKIPAIIAGLVLVALFVAASTVAGQKQATAVLIGALAGVTLYHASFGFTAGWRRIVSEGRGSGLRYQLLLIVVVSAVSFPLIEFGRSIGMPTSGVVMPVGVGMLIGAFMFGFGMQFGGGCGSGTLFVAGGGSTRMVITLVAFVAGSFLGTLNLDFWRSLPQYGAWSMVRNLGSVNAFLMLAVLLGLFAVLTVWFEKRKHGSLERPRELGTLWQGPWPPIYGVIGLAAVCILTFIFIGRPWGVTWGFTLWGAKIANASGIDVTSFDHWDSGWRLTALNRSVLYDTTSVMNFAIMAGAMGAAALAAKWKPVTSLPKIEIATAIFGGLLMGYGARLAYGCNIGAYLGGLTSGSAHGWAWLAMAFLGSSLAVLTKRRFGL